MILGLKQNYPIVIGKDDVNISLRHLKFLISFKSKFEHDLDLKFTLNSYKYKMEKKICNMIEGYMVICF